MGIFDRFGKRFRQTQTAAADDPVLRILMNKNQITRQEAMNIPALSAGIDLISQTFALIPFKLYERDEDGDAAEVKNDPRVRLLNIDPRDTLDGFQMKKAVCEDYYLGKGGYIYIDMALNETRSLRYVKEEQIAFQHTDTDPIFKQYYIWCNGRTYYPMKFIKFLRSSRDGMMGTSVIGEVQEALQAAYATLEYQLNLMANGGNRRGYLEVDRAIIDKDEMNALRSAWNTLYSNNTEHIPILNKGIRFKESQGNATELQLNSSKQLLAKEINDILHISEDYESFIREAMQPLCMAFSTALNRDFLLESEKDKYFWDADFTEVLKGNAKERYVAYQQAVRGGWITINEIRKKENLPTVDGMDTLNLGLAAVLYDVKTGTYYVPNTDKNGGDRGRDAPKINDEDKPGSEFGSGSADSDTGTGQNTHGKEKSDNGT